MTTEEDDMESEVAVEMIGLTIKEAYVYAPLPPCVAIGHRADDWNVEKWSKAVVLKVVTCRDDAWVRLYDQWTGELFAECPLPNDGTSLTTAVKPVIDSSRYFVLRIADKATRNHAFIGIGFRDRGEASRFTTELDSFRQYLRRAREAKEMRRQYLAQAAGEGDIGTRGQADGDGALEGAPRRSLSLQPGQTIKLHLDAAKKPVDKPGFLSRQVASRPGCPAGLLPLRFASSAAAKPAASTAGTDACDGRQGDVADDPRGLTSEGCTAHVPLMPALSMVATDRAYTALDDDFGEFEGA